MSKDLVLNIIMKASDKASAAFEKVKKAGGGLSGKLGETVRVLDKTNTALKRIDGLQKLRAEAAQAAASSDKLQREIKELAAAIKSQGAPTDAQVKKMQQLENASQRAAAKEQQLSDKSRALARELKSAGVNTGALASEQARLTAQAAKASAEINRQNTVLKKMESAARRLRNAPIAVAGFEAARMYASAKARAVATGFSAPVKAYAESEAAGMDLKTAMMTSGGAVAAEYRQIDELATRLGDRLPGTTADFKNLMTMLIRQGMSAKNILGGTGEAAALLAVQLKKTPDAAAEMAAKLQDATRATETEMLQVMDGVQKLFYAGVDDSNILGAFSKFSPALDVLKLKGRQAMDSVGPLIGMLDQAGLSGESAGNAMRKVFTRMMDTKKINKVAKGAGISLDFTDGAGEFGGMDKMYAELAKLKSLNTEARLKVLQGIFGDDAETLQALNTMIDKGREGYEEFGKKMAAQASLNERVNAQLGTLANLWDAASGTFTNFLASLGESIAPQLKSFTVWLGDVNEKLSIWAKNNPALAGGLMKAAAGVGILFAALAGAAAVAASLVMPFAALNYAFAALKVGALAAQFGMLKAGVFALGGAFAKFAAVAVSAVAAVGKAMLMNPIGLAITAVVAALYLLWRHWDTVKSVAVGAWTTIKTVLQNNPLAGFLAGPAGAIASLIANFDRLKAAAVSAWQSVKNAFAASSSAKANAPLGIGFSRGGYTGAGGVNEAAGIVHKGEVVFSQRDIAKFGGWQAVEALRRRGAAGLLALGEKLGAASPRNQGNVLPAPASFAPLARPVLAGAGGDNITIHIHAAPGMNEQSIVDKLMLKLKEREAAQARRRNSVFTDRD